MLQAQRTVPLLPSSSHQPCKGLKISETSTLAWVVQALTLGYFLSKSVCSVPPSPSLWWFLSPHQPKALQPGVPLFSASHFALLCVPWSLNGYPCRTTAEHRGPTTTNQLLTPGSSTNTNRAAQLDREEGRQVEETEPCLLQNCAYTGAT